MLYSLKKVDYSNLLPGIVTGPDGNLWFMTSTNTIWRVTPQGTMTPFTVPATFDTSNWASLTSAGNLLWFTDPLGHQLISMTMQGSFTPYPLPTITNDPGAITTAPDGSLWFNDLAEDKIWHFTPPISTHAQTTKKELLFQTFSVPEPSIAPETIVAGTKGDLWFSELQTHYIGRISSDGVLHEQYAASQQDFGPLIGPVVGKDGNLWFAYSYGFNQIGRLTTNGKLTIFTPQITDNSRGIYSLSSNPVDGNVWFLSGIFSYGFITPQGVTQEVGIPHNSVAYGKDDIDHLVGGPDGNLWLTDKGNNRLLTMNMQGIFSIHQLPTPNSQPGASAFDTDRTLWFSETGANQLGHLTMSSPATQGKDHFQEFSVPGQKVSPWFIVPGPRGDLWFSEEDPNTIGRITTSGHLLNDYLTLPKYNDQVEAIGDMARGKDGNLWMTEGSAIARVTPQGIATVYPMKNYSDVEHITRGPDGNLWFTDQFRDEIGRIVLVSIPPSGSRENGSSSRLPRRVSTTQTRKGQVEMH